MHPRPSGPRRLFLLAPLLLALTSPGTAADSPRLTPAQRLEPARLQAVEEARARYARQWVKLPDLYAHEDFRAVLHVHAGDSSHTRGTRDQVLAAAKKAGVRVVLFTDHGGVKPDGWSGLRDGVLFVSGSEGAEGELRFPRRVRKGQATMAGDLRFLCHAEDRPETALKAYAGLEIASQHSDRKLDASFRSFLEAAAGDAGRWAAVTQAFRRWPEAFFAAGSDPRPELLDKWDRELRRRRLPGMGGNDAHQDLVVNGVTFDPYEVSFRTLTTHLMARALSEDAVLEAIEEGHCYVSHDWLADPTGFAFGAMNNLGVFPMGDRAPMQGTTTIIGLTPVPSHQKLVYQGRVIAETNGTNLTFKAKDPGAYRLEAWLAVGGEERPWIYSNPVYLQTHGLLDIPLPNGEESPRVTVTKGLPYVPADRVKDDYKQRLDLYVPARAGGERSPVFVFMHGGAWRFGDRSLYPPLGQRFAKEGILTVIPSYRLVPQGPWPAQAEDTAAAVAWTFRNIAAHGGDTNRIYIGGHSAGGHLTSLIVCNDRFLRPHGVSSKAIRGVISLSGVYDLDIGDAMASVFGRDREVRREASPLYFIQSPAPPFFVSYCEWDYPTLPSQAKIFHTALDKAGIPSQLHYTPRDNHIYEMISFTRDEDETAQAVVRFILGRN